MENINYSDIEFCKDSVKFYGCKQKEEREKWIAGTFLENLGIKVSSEKLIIGDDPPDVLYDMCCFEIKEILDPGRRRHEEYKNDLARLKSSEKAVLEMESFTPTFISWDYVYKKVILTAQNAQTHYSTSFCSKTDLLIYYNRQEEIIKEPKLQLHPVDCDNLHWRSVSVLRSDQSRIVYISKDVPDILKHTIDLLI